METKLLQNVKKHIQLSEEEETYFVSYFKPISIQKKDFLLREGEICKFEGFVTKGLFKVCHYDEKGLEKIISFPREDWWVGDIDSFTNQKPSSYFIQALEDAEVLLISREDKENLYVNLPKVEKLFRIMGQKALIALQRRMSENLRKPAEERYSDFLEKYPQLLQRLTNLQIAAYLGVSHELLSKIRKKIVSKKII
ncbi:Crp/Fnr family transcriptional regulator [Flavobacterium sp. J27]|uniref:Crp/Fnr family transcriptional regulator n=1 Tax=Flavobacterium sp. J27 TaxID=2060419 RepID=UPI001030F3C9|nr:Crp/Fnr family transcriptional regulator [Flavobacterium sp. J27]